LGLKEKYSTGTDSSAAWTLSARSRKIVASMIIFSLYSSQNDLT
jgi:hypothetical protein